MSNKLKIELDHFKSQPHNFKILILTNLVYALVGPVIDVFVAAYIMRNTNGDITKVVTYQLTVYTGIPLTFLLNGYLLKHFNIRKLYSAGMLLSGISIMFLMSLTTINTAGIAIAGLIMGMSFGLFWANRDVLALSTTDDKNRNYYYGLETFIYTIIAIIIPITIGLFLNAQHGDAAKHTGYIIINGFVFGITILSSIICFRGKFENPVHKQYVFLKFHPLWYRLLSLAALKGLAQGFLVTAPSMLIMKFFENEGALGSAQTVGALISALIIYIIGRMSRPTDRLKIFAAGLIFFAIGAICNGIFYDKIGVIIFIFLLLIAKPLMDLAYFPIQFKVIDIVKKIENRGEFAYILNHESGLYVGRFLGAATFLVMARYGSADIALRFAIVIIALLQLASLAVAKNIIRRGEELDSDLISPGSLAPKVIHEVAERMI